MEGFHRRNGLFFIVVVIVVTAVIPCSTLAVFADQKLLIKRSPVPVPGGNPSVTSPLRSSNGAAARDKMAAEASSFTADVMSGAPESYVADWKARGKYVEDGDDGIRFAKRIERTPARGAAGVPGEGRWANDDPEAGAPSLFPPGGAAASFRSPADPVAGAPSLARGAAAAGWLFPPGGRFTIDPEVEAPSLARGAAAGPHLPTVGAASEQVFSLGGSFTAGPEVGAPSLARGAADARRLFPLEDDAASQRLFPLEDAAASQRVFPQGGTFTIDPKVEAPLLPIGVSGERLFPPLDSACGRVWDKRCAGRRDRSLMDLPLPTRGANAPLRPPDGQSFERFFPAGGAASQWLFSKGRAAEDAPSLQDPEAGAPLPLEGDSSRPFPLVGVLGPYAKSNRRSPGVAWRNWKRGSPIAEGFLGKRGMKGLRFLGSSKRNRVFEGFLGMRGKKGGDGSPGTGGVNFASGFLGMRGKKYPVGKEDGGWWGDKAKAYSAPSAEEPKEAWQDGVGKRIPEGFVGMRGRRRVGDNAPMWEPEMLRFPPPPPPVTSRRTSGNNAPMWEPEMLRFPPPPPPVTSRRSSGTWSSGPWVPYGSDTYPNFAQLQARSRTDANDWKLASDRRLTNDRKRQLGSIFIGMRG